MRKITVAPFFLALTLWGQPVSFEAATIKPSAEAAGHSSWHSRPGYLVMKNQTLRQLAGIAYGVKEDRVSGSPKWADSDRFDIEARANGPAKDPELLRMLQSLLADRFQLAVHPDTRMESGFSLAIIKASLKIPPDETEGGPSSKSGRGKITVQRITMQEFADALSRVLGTAVMDATGAKGAYTFTLEWTPDDPVGTPLDAVLAQQLGLKLENKKFPVEIIVIDRAAKPTRN